MSVKPATDENRAAWTGTVTGWLDGPIPRSADVVARDVMYLVGVVLCLDARIDQDAETIRALTTRAEEAEALLREALDYVQSSTDGTRARRDTLARIEAHLQEHAE